MKTFLVFTLFVGSVSACQNNAANSNKTVSNVTNNVSLQKDATTINLSEVKTGQGIGVVTKINLELGSVELKHEEIKGMMPAMQMEFYVADKKELESLKVGDKAIFTLEDNKGAEKIIKISKVE